MKMRCTLIFILLAGAACNRRPAVGDSGFYHSDPLVDEFLTVTDTSIGRMAKDYPALSSWTAAATGAYWTAEGKVRRAHGLGYCHNLVEPPPRQGAYEDLFQTNGCSISILVLLPEDAKQNLTLHE
jgi:hypothetical protein